MIKAKCRQYMYHTVILNIEYEVTTDTGNYVIQEVIIIIRMIIAVMPQNVLGTRLNKLQH